MNYYEHHIGDYSQATSHLSFIEDATYSRLLRKYYATEKPMPADVKTVQRLVNAKSKEEKNAVELVLKEFFMLTEDGWRQGRCDHEIARFKDKQAKAKRSADSRWQPTAITNPNIASTTKAQPDLDPNQACVRIAEALPTQCSPNTKHQSPISKHQTIKSMGESKVKKISESGVQKKKEDLGSIDDLDDLDDHVVLSDKHKRFAELISKEGASVSVDDCRIKDMVATGASEEEVIAAISIAREMRKKISTASPINAGYVLAIVKCEIKKRVLSVKADAGEIAWWKTNEGIDAKGRELSMRAQGSESYESYKARIFAELRKRQEIGKPTESVDPDQEKSHAI
jgi:uncharacterized protein YdaU (DUF1376 family)